MKKLIKSSIGLFMCAVLMLSVFNISVLAENDSSKDINVIVNGKKIEFDVQPFMENNSVMVPFRQIAEAMGVIVEWDDATSTIIGYLSELDNDDSIEKYEYITIGERKISNLSHTEYFGFGNRNKITIKDWYLLYF